MSDPLIGALGFLGLFALLAMGMHIAFAMLLVGFIGLVAMVGLTGAIGVLSTAPYSIVADYMFVAVALFVFMGTLAFEAGIITDAYTVGRKWLGRLPGGLAMATIAGCAGFAACTGSSAASVSFMTTSTLPEMERNKYDPRLSTGAIASGSTLGILIPPSIPLVVYALFAQQSVGELFIAGVIPGIILSCLFIITIYIWCRLRPSAGPPGPPATWRERISSLRYVWSILALVALVLGGIWSGLFTPVEAAGIGGIGAFLIGLVKRRMTFKVFIASVKDATRIIAMIFAIVVGAMILNRFIALSGLPALLATWVGNSNMGTVGVLAAIVVFYIIGGMLMEAFGLMVLSMPVLIPIVDALGVNLVAYGILMVLMIEMAEITPPIGLNVFILSGVAKHIPMYTIFRGVVPFCFAILIMVILIIAFPQLATFLPSTMIGK
jgi:tripartite ATP-independent transporter DctM subunit